MNIAFNLNGTHLTRTDTNYLRANMTEEVIGTIIYDNSWELPLKVKISYDIYTEIIDVVNDDFTLPKLSTGVFGFNMVVMDKNHQSMNLFQPIGLPAKELAGGGGAGLEVIEITDVPTTSTSGTLNEAQMAIVNSNTPSCVKFNNEYYYKNDDNHTEGIAVYTHTGYTETDGGSTIKYITVTISTAAWVLTVQNIGGGKYSKHLHYDIHLEGSWDPASEIMTFDTATQNAIKVVLDKLDELTTGDNYDFLVNMRVAGKTSAEGDIVVIGANMKLTHVPGSEAVARNLQAQFIVSVDTSDTAKIVITDNEFTSNNQMFRAFMTGVYTVFQFDINY